MQLVMRWMVWLGCCAATASGAQTAPHDLPTWYIQAGGGDGSSGALVIGTTAAWKAQPWRLGSGNVQGHWDAWLGAWSNRDAQRKRFHTIAAGAGPNLRWRPSPEGTPWFLEAGTGVMVTGQRLYRSGQRMGTRWNFATHIGIGMNFGAQHSQEISVRLQHASNAGIRSPNPGINFVHVRYAHTF